MQRYNHDAFSQWEPLKCSLVLEARVEVGDSTGFRLAFHRHNWVHLNCCVQANGLISEQNAGSVPKQKWTMAEGQRTANGWLKAWQKKTIWLTTTSSEIQ